MNTTDSSCCCHDSRVGANASKTRPTSSARTVRPIGFGPRSRRVDSLLVTLTAMAVSSSRQLARGFTTQRCQPDVLTAASQPAPSTCHRAATRCSCPTEPLRSPRRARQAAAAARPSRRSSCSRRTFQSPRTLRLPASPRTGSPTGTGCRTHSSGTIAASRAGSTGSTDRRRARVGSSSRLRSRTRAALRSSAARKRGGVRGRSARVGTTPT